MSLLRFCSWSVSVAIAVLSIFALPPCPLSYGNLARIVFFQTPLPDADGVSFTRGMCSVCADGGDYEKMCSFLEEITFDSPHAVLFAAFSRYVAITTKLRQRSAKKRTIREQCHSQSRRRREGRRSLDVFTVFTRVSRGARRATAVHSDRDSCPKVKKKGYTNMTRFPKKSWIGLTDIILQEEGGKKCGWARQSVRRPHGKKRRQLLRPPISAPVSAREPVAGTSDLRRRRPRQDTLATQAACFEPANILRALQSTLAPAPINPGRI